MRKKGIQTIVFSILLTWSATVEPLTAGGTWPTEKVLELVKKDKRMFKWLTAHFDLNPTSSAPRIGSRVNLELGGLRIAPYAIEARPKGTEGSWTFVIEVHAITRFFDQEGREVSLSEGVRAEEEFTHISMRSLSAERGQDGGEPAADGR